ncbi:MAG TPA: OmpA family protein [Stellaceae bacterium]|nr:OmpA family protein [Stellaceae bacterium]
MAGARGETGAVGPAGPQGLAGPVGAQGSSYAGPAGPTGPVGPAGAQGFAGPAGAKGDTLVGPSGPVGNTGVAGAQGGSGLSGPQGLASAGLTGVAGRPGVAGTQGPTGPAGAQGPVGIVANWTAYRDYSFDSGRSDIQPSDSNTASDIAAYMERNPSLQIALDGFRDSGAADARSQRLSDRRVNAVRAALIKAGVPASKIRSGAFADPQLAHDGQVVVLLSTGI